MKILSFLWQIEILMAPLHFWWPKWSLLVWTDNFGDDLGLDSIVIRRFCIHDTWLFGKFSWETFSFPKPRFRTHATSIAGLIQARSLTDCAMEAVSNFYMRCDNFIQLWIIIHNMSTVISKPFTYMLTLVAFPKAGTNRRRKTTLSNSSFSCPSN